MVAIITNKFRLTQAEIFRDAIELGPDSYYLFVGRPQPWEYVPVNSDLVPEPPQDTLFSERRIWEGMMGLKKIQPNNTSFVIRRWNWDATGQTVYVAYSDQDSNLFEHPTPAEVAEGQLNGYTPGSFYVMNQYFQVFKCLNNNNGAKSTVEPVTDESQPLLLLNLGDGYTWKYMFTLQTSDAVKYLTDDWIPVKTLTADDGSTQWTVQSGAADTGVIDSIQIINGGSLYNRVLDDSAVASIGSSGPNQTIITNNVDASPNNAWYAGTTLWVVGGAGLGSYSKVVDYFGATKEFVLETTLSVDNTSVFQILPSVEIEGDGTGAVAKSSVDFGAPSAITGISIINAGANYNYATATIVGGNSGSASNFAELEVVLPPEGGHGGDPVKELGGTYVMINVDLNYNEGSGDFPISNDYRQIGLIKNPEEYNNPGVPLSSLTATASTRLTVSSVVGTFPLDDILIEQSPGSAQAFLVETIDAGATKDLVYIQTTDTGFDSFTVGNTVTATGASGVIDAITPPEAEIYTGDVLYFENRRPILRAPDQLENIKVIISF